MIYMKSLCADVGDDAICINSGVTEDSWRVGKATKNVIIEDYDVMPDHGGYIEDVWFEDIFMMNIGWEAVQINMFYGTSSGTSRSDTPLVCSSINLQSIRCEGTGEAVFITGLSEEYFESVRIENMNISARMRIVVYALLYINCSGRDLSEITRSLKLDYD